MSFMSPSIGPGGSSIPLNTTAQAGAPTSQTPAAHDPVRMAIGAMNGNRPPSPKLSAATEDILRRLNNAHSGNKTSTPDFEAAKESILKGMVTSDKIPLPPPAASRRGRPPGRGGAGNGSRSGSIGVAASTPDSASKGRGRGRGRGGWRGRGGGGRGGKRKREDSDVESEMTKTSETSDSDLELDGDEEDGGDDQPEYTPQPTRTKSGRNVNKPSQFVPSLPSPASANKKRRPYRRNPESALCKACHRGHSPNNNQIVFCDGCGAAFHQYCHDPPIDRETVLVPEKEWFCAACVRKRSREVAGTALEGLVSGENLSNEQKRAYLSKLPAPRLVNLLIHASVLHPSLPLFPPSKSPAADANTTAAPALSAAAIQHDQPDAPPSPFQEDAEADADAEPEDDNADADAEADIVMGEDLDSHQPHQQQHHHQPQPQHHTYDGYDTDPPAHYPKPGNGLARTLRPEADDLEFLVDNNADVFSHDFEDYTEDAPPATAGAERDAGIAGGS